ncbi:hypothetical protein AgCh_012030 [Apium graveolens]
MDQSEFKIYPDIIFHGEPVIPKDEPVDWESLPLPDLNIPIQTKPRKTKKRAIKKVKPIRLESKALVKPKLTINKGDQLFICDIKEFSDINLYLDELEEARSIDAYKHLPKRLVFKYKGERELTWPLHRILNEGYYVMYKKLTTQLGFFVKDGMSFPLTTECWVEMDLTIIEKWRDWKCRVKKNGYYAYTTDEKRLANCPASVIESQWPVLVSKWGREDVEEELEISRQELKEANKDTPEELEHLFIDKFGEEKHGRICFLGHGITPSMVYGRNNEVPTTSAETVVAIRAEFEEKFELQK